MFKIRVNNGLIKAYWVDVLLKNEKLVESYKIPFVSLYKVC